MTLSSKSLVVIIYHAVSLILVFIFVHQNHFADNMCGPSADMLITALVFFIDIALLIISIVITLMNRQNKRFLFINFFGIGMLFLISSIA